MNGVMKKVKWFIVSTLVILVVGITLFGVFGFNNTGDYSSSFDLRVTITQPIEKAQQTLKTTADKYMAEKGINVISTQTLDNGIGYVFKFAGDVSEQIADLEQAINDALSQDPLTATVTVADFDPNFASGYGDNNVKGILIAMSIAVVLIFVYTLIMDKLAAAVAVICSAILSALVFIALMSITRLPSIPYVQLIALAFSFVLGAVMSIMTTGRLKEAVKNQTGKFEYDNLAVGVMNAEKKKTVLALVAVFVASVALMALFASYTAIVGASLLVAGVSAVGVSYFITPLLWTTIKTSKKK